SDNAEVSKKAREAETKITSLIESLPWGKAKEKLDNATLAKVRCVIADLILELLGLKTEVSNTAAFKKPEITAALTPDKGNLPQYREAFGKTLIVRQTEIASPVIDGKLDDACWKTAVEFNDFRLFKTDGTPAASTSGRLLIDNDNLYLAFICSEPAMNKIRQKYLTDQFTVIMDDSIEVFLSPCPDSTTYFQFVFNTLGRKHVQMRNYAQSVIRYPNLEWEVKTVLGKNRWQAELKIPLKAIAQAKSNFWKVNFCRNRYASPELSSWSFCPKAFNDMQALGSLIFRGEQYTVTGLSFLAQWGNSPVGLKIKNEDNTARTVDVNIRYDNANKKSISVPAEIAAGGEREIAVPVSLVPSVKEQLLNIAVRDKADRIFYGFSYPFSFSESQALNLKADNMLLSASERNLGVNIGLNAAPGYLAESALALSLTQNPANKIFEKKFTKLNSGMDLLLAMDFLPAGNYNLGLEFTGPDGNKLTANNNFWKITGNTLQF
ncbi:MAG: sugar-binding protein, partial [Victivallaceae bacterium]|nr:sugar-binding protein [Victivallaceae bacterium]